MSRSFLHDILCAYLLNCTQFCGVPALFTTDGSTVFVLPRTGGTMGSRTSCASSGVFFGKAITSRLAFAVFRGLFLRQLDDFRKPSRDFAVIRLFVRYSAARAVLYAAFQNAEVAAALFPERVQGAVAEQTVEGFRMVGFVARKVFALGILKERIMLIFPVFGHITTPFSAF